MAVTEGELDSHVAVIAGSSSGNGHSDLIRIGNGETLCRFSV